MQIHWTKSAVRNLDQIEEHLAAENSKIATNTIHNIIDAIARLSDHPGMGRPGEILRILHPSMHWPEYFN